MDKLIKYGFKDMDTNKDYLFNTKKERDLFLLDGQLNKNFWNTYTFKNINNLTVLLGV